MPYSDNTADSLSERNKNNIMLAQKAADNDVPARKQVNDLIQPVIQYQTNRFCKRFCKENRAHFKCTLNPPISSASVEASLCEWGNGSYAWMLDDLSNSSRLKKYQAKNNASLFDYCYVIANSLPFYERWKDWRFARKIYVPSYIRDLGKMAVTVFYGLRSQKSAEQISHSTTQTIEDIKALNRKIIQLLIQKNKLHLLNPLQAVSLSQEADDNHAQSSIESETASYDEAIEQREDKRLLSKAWGKLSAVEQYVLEALIIEEQDAEIVLSTLKKLNLSFKDDVAAESLDRQQVYYFRRKTLAKLSAMLKA